MTVSTAFIYVTLDLSPPVEIFISSKFYDLTRHDTKEEEEKEEEKRGTFRVGWGKKDQMGGVEHKFQ